MVVVLIRLKLTLLRRSLARNTSRLIAFVLGGLLAIVLALGSIAVAASLRGASVENASFTILLLSVVTAGWTLAPLLTVGIDSSLDAERLSVLPLRARSLIPGLTAAGLVGIPGVLTVMLGLDQLLVWSRSVLTLTAALLGAVIAVLTSVMLSRAATSVLARSMWQRRSRFLAMSVVPLLYVVPAALNLLLFPRNGEGGVPGAGRFREASLIAGWTPFGWAWSLPWRVARGAYGPALVALVLAVAFLIAVALVWERALAAELTSTAPRQSSKVRGLRASTRRSGPLLAVTRNRLLAWRRDPRLAGQAISMTAVGLLVAVAGTVGPSDAGFGGLPVSALIALMAGLVLASDLAYDGSAWWMQVAAGVPGWVDRAGRVIATGLPALFVALLVSLAQLALGGTVDWLVYGGPVASVFFIALGVGCLLGAIDPGQAAQRGSNPFAGTSGNGAQGCLTAAAMFLIPIVVAIPVILGAAFARDSVAVQVLMIFIGVVWGVAVLGTSIWWSGHHLDRTSSDMLVKLRVFD